MSRSPRTAALLGTGFVIAALVASCGGDDTSRLENAARDRPSTTTTSTTAPTTTTTTNGIVGSTGEPMPCTSGAVQYNGDVLDRLGGNPDARSAFATFVSEEAPRLRDFSVEEREIAPPPPDPELGSTGEDGPRGRLFLIRRQDQLVAEASVMFVGDSWHLTSLFACQELVG